MPDYYELLGVTRDATDDEIKRAYRALARQHHPDANPGDAEAEARFKEISVAYETLRDPERRRRYDMFGEGQAAGQGPEGFGLNDLFDAFFGGDLFGSRRGPNGPVRGPDLESRVELTLVEAAFGATRVVQVRMPVSCPRCEGSGCEPGTHPARCETCGGVGEVRQVRRSLLGQVVTASPCPACGATGTRIPAPCRDCRGDGRVGETRRFRWRSRPASTTASASFCAVRARRRPGAVCPVISTSVLPSRPIPASSARATISCTSGVSP
jgi:molecular chaperone DnaJ